MNFSRLGLLWFLIFIYYPCSSQCIINDFKIIAGPCNQRGQFYITIDLNSNENFQRFNVIGNGINYGTFSYSTLPIKIGPLKADCITDYEFLIRDSLIANCQLYKKIGTFCCDDLCKIRISDISATNCENSKYGLGLNFENISFGGQFDIYNNSKKLGSYPVADLPISLNNIESNLNETFNQISVCAVNEKVCCDTVMLANPCICTIANLRGQIINCNDKSEEFSVKINLDYHGTSDSFRVGGNLTNYGTFAYKDLPIIIKDLPFSNDMEYEFLVIDNGDPFCFSSFEQGTVNGCNFNCNLEKLEVRPEICDSNHALVSLTFLSINPGVNGFSIFVNSENKGQYQYGNKDYLIKLPKIDCLNQYSFTISDRDISDCRLDTLVSFKECCTQKCKISDVAISEQCVNNNLQSVGINFNHVGVSDSFALTVNDIKVSNYSYSDLPVSITNLNYSQQDVSIRISDTYSDHCAIEIPYTILCHPPPVCSISEFNVVPGECNNEGKFTSKLEFIAKNAVSPLFQLKINGLTADTVTYGDSLYKIFPLIGDCITPYTFSLFSVQDSLCQAHFELADIICCRACKLSEPVISYLPCIDGKYDLKLDFKYKGTNELFDIKINNRIIGTYRYSDLPIIIHGIDTNTEVNLKIEDTQNKICFLEIILNGKPCPSATNDLISKHMPVYSSQDKVFIQLGNFTYQVRILAFDITGRIIYQADVSQDSQIDISTWPRGMYFIDIVGKETKFRQRVMKL